MVVCDAADKPLVLLHLLRTRVTGKALCFAASVDETHRCRRLVRIWVERVLTCGQPVPPTGAAGQRARG
jgi:hypothetical protein